MTKRNLYLRRTAFALMILITVCLNFSFGKFLTVGSAAPLLVLPLVITIAMNENSLWAVLFGVLAGVLTDCFSISEDGFYGVAFAVAAFAASSLVTFFVRRTFAAAAVFMACASLLVFAAYWFFFLVLKGYDMLFVTLVEKYIASAVYTLAFVVLFYPLTKWICNRLSREDGANEN